MAILAGWRSWRRVLGPAAGAILLGACSDSLPLPSLPSLPIATPEFPGSAATVFARIVKGSNTCWFGPKGALDRTYILHGRADPEAKGGTAEILIHERVDQNYRGLKAFAITIAPVGEGAAVTAKNLKMAEEIGKRMTADAYRWAHGGLGCHDGDTSWTVAPEPAKPPVKGRKAQVQPKAASAESVAAKAETGKPVAPLGAPSRKPQ